MQTPFKPLELPILLLVLLTGAVAASQLGYTLQLDTFEQALVLLVVGPVLEEFVFRHQLQQGLAARWAQPKLALFASSLLFALCHAPWMGWPAIGLLFPGLLLGWYWMRFKKLTYNVALHSAMNAALAFV